MSDTKSSSNKPPVETFRKARPAICGPDAGPEPPFPITLHGEVQSGFGRGSKELGCPTANLPDDAISPLISVAKTGVYFGYARVHQSAEKPVELGKEGVDVHPMVMSLGWNPFYKNEKMTAEVHVMHEYSNDFYGHEISVLVLGYIRPELDYTSRDALIEDIQTDIRVAKNSLARPSYQKFLQDVSWCQQGKGK